MQWLIGGASRVLDRGDWSNKPLFNVIGVALVV